MTSRLLLMVFITLAVLQASSCWGQGHSTEPFRISQIADDTGSLHYFPILQEAYRRIGIQVVAVPLPAERALREANVGQTDAAAFRMEGVEALYPNLVRVPEPVVSVALKVFTTGRSFSVTGWESLRPYTICCMHGIKLYEQGTRDMARVSALGLENAVKLLRQGLCEVALFTPEAWMMIDLVNAGPMRELEPPVTTFNLYHYVHRNHVDLVPLLAAELKKMKQEGRIEAILKPHQDALLAAKARQSFP